MDGWAAELQSGRPDAAWDLFLDRYRRLIFAAIHHYAQDFLDQRSHVKAHELIHATEAPALSFKEFLTELRATCSAVSKGRRGRMLGDLGGPPPAEEAPAASSPGDLAETRAL